MKDDGMPALQSNMMMMMIMMLVVLVTMMITMTMMTATMMTMMMITEVVVVVMPSIQIGSITCNCMRMALNNTIVRVNFFQY